MNKIKSEFQLINWIRNRRQVVNANVIKGIGDDMAIIECGSEKLLITTDMLLDGVHFDLAAALPEQVGYKAMACSLSDCAAMCSTPSVAVVAVALPKTMDMDQAKRLNDGVQKAATEFKCPVVGGDTTSWDNPLAINVTMLSKATEREPVLRSGAAVGDAIFVTGQLGGSLTGRHLDFIPRVTESLQLGGMVNLHAMIDVSDGLASDLGHICSESKVSAIIEAQALPVSEAAAQCDDPIKAALTDGEDFELLFTVSQSDAEKLDSQWTLVSSTNLTRIGEIIKRGDNDATIMIRNCNGKIETVTCKGWEHFCD